MNAWGRAEVRSNNFGMELPVPYRIIISKAALPSAGLAPWGSDVKPSRVR